jgi:predicted nucleic acid-binding protein
MNSPSRRLPASAGSRRRTPHSYVIYPAWRGHLRPVRRNMTGYRDAPDPLFSKVVVDASIVSKWFVPERYSEEARRLLTGGYEILVPDLMFDEFTAILRTHIAAGRASSDEADEIRDALRKMPLESHGTWSLAEAALDIERRIPRAIYQCIHLALAVQQQAVLVTSDRKLYKSVRGNSLAAHVCWIEDVR